MAEAEQVDQLIDKMKERLNWLLKNQPKLKALVEALEKTE